MGYKKLMKDIKKKQRELERVVRLEQATCSHVSKKGKSKLVTIDDSDDGVLRARCKRCNDIVIIDRKVISETIDAAVDTVKSVLAEIRSASNLGYIRLDDHTIKLMTKFDAEILRDLPATFDQLSSVVDGGEKKKKKKKKKEKKRRRW